MIPPQAEVLELPIGDWMTTVAPSLNQEVLRFVFLDLHTLPGWKVAQIISARHALLSDRNPRAKSFTALVHTDKPV